MAILRSLEKFSLRRTNPKRVRQWVLRCLGGKPEGPMGAKAPRDCKREKPLPHVGGCLCALELLGIPTGLVPSSPDLDKIRQVNAILRVGWSQKQE